MTESHHKESILIVQPTLKHYRVPVYSALNNHFDLRVICSEADIEAGALNVDISKLIRLPGGFLWQQGVCDLRKLAKTDAVWIAADIHYLSSLLLTVLCRIMRIPVILHGQGLFKKSSSPKLRSLALKGWIALSDRYVTYGEASTRSLKCAGVSPGKIRTIQNRFEAPVDSRPSPGSQTGDGVIFVGRLRSGSGIGSLLDAMDRINKNRENPVYLHVVGEGADLKFVEPYLSGDCPWLVCHGRITDPDILAGIAARCSIGVYPGKAGLSVLTYMGLGLAPIVGDDLSEHMGPEPAYVVDGETGWTFSSGDSESLFTVLRDAINSPDLPRIRSGSRGFYEDLHKQSYGEEMSLIFREAIGDPK